MIGFDEIRKIFEKIIEIFNRKDSVRQKLTKFESIISQVINFKSIENFELFVKLFDIVIDNSGTYVNRYSKNDLIELYQKLQYKKKKDFKNIYNYINYDETLNLVLETYSFVEENFPKERYDSIRFDIFLSHKYSNKYFNLIIYYILTYYYGLNVYVDWIYDRHANRTRLSARTVDLLSNRLNQSCNLLFFNLEQTKTTNWMAWEVGYFAGINRKGVGILDLSNYYGKNQTSIEVLSSGHRFIYNDYDFIEDNSLKSIEKHLKCLK